MKRGRILLLSSLVLAPLVTGGLLHGCSDGTSGNHHPVAGVVQITSASQAADLLKGPDAIGGLGTGQGNDIGDYLMFNDKIRAVIDQPGTDPTSLGAAFPLANVLSSAGGTLVDLGSRFSDNDQFIQMAQGVVGRITLVGTNPDTGVIGAGGAGTTGSTSTTGGNAFIDPTVDFAAAGVTAGDTLTIFSGGNAGRSYQIAAVVNPNTLGLFIQPGLPFVEEDLPPPGTINYLITSTLSPLENIVVYDDATIVSAGTNPAILRVSGGVVNAGRRPDNTTVDPASGRLLAGGSPITVENDYVLFQDAAYLQLNTRITNPSSLVIGVVSPADIMITGGASVPNLLPWTPLTGFAAQGLDSALIVPFMALSGRDEPAVSYAMVDSLVGQMIHLADGNLVAVNLQLSSATSLAGNGVAAWQRSACVGQRNDVASAADTAIALLANSPIRVNPANGTTIPNGYETVQRISGEVRNFPPGTRVTAIQVAPALVFGPGAPNGNTAAPGFFSSTILGAPELIITETRPNPITGHFNMLVPRSFSGLASDATAPADLSVPAGLENGTDEAIYRILVEAPGHDPQSVIVHLPAQQSNNLLFDLRDETGTIELVATDETGAAIPCKFLIRGMDPDGPGPAPTTANPVFGGPTAGVAEPRAAGIQNEVFLLNGTGSVQVAPGSYQVIATRGMEYTVDRYPPEASSVDFFTVAAGATVRTENAGVPMQITRVLDSGSLPEPGGGGTFESPLRRYISADLHVHSGGSFDSAVPTRDRAIAFMATGLEMLISTEHDNLVDYGPILADIAEVVSGTQGNLMLSQVGVEATGFVGVNIPGTLEFPNTIGHFNAFPIPFDPTLRRNGAPADEFRSPADLFAGLNAAGATLIQINHPRNGILDPPLPPIGLGFFSNGKAGFPQPNTGAAAVTAGGFALPLRSSSTALVMSNDGSIDDLNTVRLPSGRRYNEYDTHELFDGPTPLYELNRIDWYAMISAGYVRTGTGNSDTHVLTGKGAHPRNYVAVSGNGSADLANVNIAEFNANLLPSLVQSTPGTNVFGGMTSFPATERAGGGADDMDVLVSSGIVVYAEVDADEDGNFESGPGDLSADDGDGLVNVRVTVVAPAWVPVDTVSIIINGGNFAEVVLSVPGSGVLTGLGGSNPAAAPPAGGNASGSVLFSSPTDQYSESLTDVVRMRETFTMALPPSPLSGDHWLIVEARGTPVAQTNGDTPVYNLLLPGFGTAIGFTNPIFVDTNNDGEWDPNGLP